MPANGNGKSAHSNSEVGETPVMPAVSGTRTGLVEYPLTLREGRFAYLRLPADLTPGDVKRLTAYLNTLTLEE